MLMRAQKQKETLCPSPNKQREYFFGDIVFFLLFYRLKWGKKAVRGH